MTMFFTGGINGEWVDIPPTIEIFEPPDDRYLSGYKITDNVDGDVKIFGPRLKDLNVPFSLYGLPIPITFGVRRLTGNIIWARPLRESIQKDKKGGKGGPTTKSTEYKYFATFAVAFGIPGNTDSDSRDIIRMWAQNALIMDRRGYAAAKWTGLDYTFYKGEADQPQDPTIVSYEGASVTPAYRDVMYVVFRDMPIEDFNNYIPSIGIEVGDTTALEYIIQNIETTAFEGSKVYDAGFADFYRGEYYAVRSGIFGSTSVARSYNLVNAMFMGNATVNDVGVGWDNNNATGDTNAPSLKYVTGISANFNSLGYCPWLNLLWGKPDDLNTGEPFMLVDPTSGVVRYWLGCHIYSSIALDPKWPGMSSLEFGPVNGIIPQWDNAMCFRAYADLSPTIFFMITTVYNDLVLLKLDSVMNHLDMVWWMAGWGRARCMIEGELRPYESDFYLTKSGSNEVWRMVVRAAAHRVGAGSSATSSGVEDPEVVYTAGANIHAMLYYAADNSLILFKTNGQVEKVDIETWAQVWNVSISDYSSVGPVYSMHLHNLESGTFAWTNDGSVYEMNLVTGAVTNWPEADNRFDAAYKYSDGRNSSIAGLGTVSSAGSPGSTTDSIDYAQSTLLYNRISDSRMPLADFILGMSLYAGFLESEIDISAEIDDMIDGAIISKLTSYKAVMQAICVAYRIEMFESAGVIKFTRRALGSGSTVFDVTDDDLLVQDPSQLNAEAPTLQIRREEELVVPQEVSLRYIDKSLSYQWNMASARRSQFITTNGSDEQMSLELPIIMTAAEAKEICTRILWQAWNSRVSYSFRVSQEFVKVEPGDFGTLTSQNKLFNIKVAQVTYNTDFSLNLQATNSISDESITIIADSGGQGDDAPNGPSISDIFVFDVPLLLPELDGSVNDTFPYYVYVGPISYEQPWAGGSGFLTLNGTTYNQINTNTDTGLVMIVKNVAEFDEGIWMSWNEDAYLTCIPKNGDIDLLTSSTRAEVLEGENLAFWGDNGRWELIGFSTVTDNGDGSFTLSDLLRGLRGTDFNMNNHQVGDYLVLMNTDLIDAIYAQNTQVDTTHIFKAVGFGLELGDGVPKTTTMAGYGALPVAPTAVTASRSISAGTGDIVLDWDRRGRLMRPMVPNDDNVDLTDNELDEYLVTVYRWPHYDAWTFSGGKWNGKDTGVDPDSFTIVVAGATTTTITAATLRANEIYEYNAPDNMYSSGSTFSQHEAGYAISANAEANEQIPDLGYDEFVAFRSIDVMIQQKTTIGNATGYGPGRRMTIVIKDT